MARSKPQLDNRPLHGPRRKNLRIPLAQYRGQNGVLSGKQGPGLLLSPYPPLCVFPRFPPTARVFGKGRALAEAGLDTPGFRPPVDAGLALSKRGGPSVSLDLTVTRAWERWVLPLPSLGKRSWEGINLRGSAGPGIGTPLPLSEGRRPVPASRPLFECCPGGSRALGPPFQTFPPSPCGTTCCSSRAEQ